jgi:hypothetical protein
MSPSRPSKLFRERSAEAIDESSTPFHFSALLHNKSRGIVALSLLRK